MTQSSSLPVDKETVLKVAKNLQSTFTKQTIGEPRKWRDVPADERAVWMKVARTAVRVLVPNSA